MSHGWSSPSSATDTPLAVGSLARHDCRVISQPRHPACTLPPVRAGDGNRPLPRTEKEDSYGTPSDTAARRPRPDSGWLLLAPPLRTPLRQPRSHRRAACAGCLLATDSPRGRSRTASPQWARVSLRARWTARLIANPA
jgi:hypothetical protein